MKILFLGTGAADWPLKPEEKMEEGGRRYSSMLIDGKILLDVAPQSYAFAKRLGIDLSGLTDCFISHTHSDHYNKEALLSFAKECGGLRLHLHRDAVPRLGFSEDEKRLFEILPMGVFDDAKAGGAAVISTGRSDFPNQINNVLAFPGIFRGTFDVRASDINEEMKMAAAKALADLISPEELSADYIIPYAFDPKVGPAVAKAVAQAAIDSGVARI